MVDDAVVAQPRVLGVGIERAQAGVEHEHVRRPAAGDAQRFGEVRWCSGRLGGRRHGGRVREPRRARRAGLPDASEVPGHAVGEVHLVRTDLVAVRPHAVHQSVEGRHPPPLGTPDRALGRRRSERDRAARRWLVTETVAEHVELLLGDDPLHGIEAVVVELDDHGVRADEAQPPGRIGRHGDAPARQLRRQGPERALELDEVGHHVRR